MQGAVWRVGRRAPITTEGSQRLCCTGSGSLVRHRARSATRNDRRRRHTATEGSRGSAAPEGEPRPTLNSKEMRLMEGLSLRPKGAAALLHRRGESPLRLSARRGLTRRKKGSHYNRREPAALLHREWEPRPPPSTQRNSKWQTEASHCDRREPWVCCTGRGAPSDAE